MVPPRVPEARESARLNPSHMTTSSAGFALVVRIGVAWVTTLVSPRSLQAVAVAALLVSPLFFTHPRSTAVCPLSLHDALPISAPPPELTTVLGLVKIAALPQVASFGP